MSAANDPYSTFPEVTARQGDACFARGRIIRPRSYFNPHKFKHYSGETDTEILDLPLPRFSSEVTRLMREDTQRSRHGTVKLYGSKTYYKSGLGAPTAGNADLVWFHLSVADQADEFRSGYHGYHKDLATSRIFNQEPLSYSAARYRYHMDFNDLIEQYKLALGLSNVAFRIYGTTWYYLEIMHTILICPPYWRVNMPLVKLGLDERAFRVDKYDDEYALFWKPWCTVGNIHNQCWDHVSVAFLMPEVFGNCWEVDTDTATMQTLGQNGRFGFEKLC